MANVTIPDLTALGANVAAGDLLEIADVSAANASRKVTQAELVANLGTPASIVLTNATGTAASLTAGAVTNGVTAASAAAGSGLLWTSGGADRSAVATDTVTTINATNSNVDVLKIMDAVDQSHGLSFVVSSNLAADKTFTYTGAFNFTMTLSADTSVTYPTSGTLLASGGALGTPASGNLSSCTADGTNAVGYRNVPLNAKTGAYTLLASDVGKVIPNTTGGWTVNNSVHAAGDVILVYNDSASSQNITAGTISTMRLAGTTTTGTRALAARGLATLYFQTASEVIVSGSGVT